MIFILVKNIYKYILFKQNYVIFFFSNSKIYYYFVLKN